MVPKADAGRRRRDVSDLERAVAADEGLVDADTVVVTTVHERQILPSGAVPMTGHDLHVDVIVTRIAAIPFLGSLRR